MCVTFKTSLPQSINIYTDTCHKSARLANKRIAKVTLGDFTEVLSEGAERKGTLT